MGKGNEKYRKMYDDAISAVIHHLIKYSTPNKLTYIAEKINGIISPKMDHLVNFFY